MLSLNTLNTLNNSTHSTIAMYAKIFVQIYDGTLCTHGPWEALVTFQQFLILSDRNGIVDMTAAAISRRTTIPIGIINTGINALLRPDPESRTPDEDGRRLIPLSDGRDWGWKIVNYAHYRKIMREDDRRDYHRHYWKKRKEIMDRERKLNTTQHTQLESTNQPIAYANAYANTDIVVPDSSHPDNILTIPEIMLVKKKEKSQKKVTEKTTFAKPTLAELTEYCLSRKNHVDPAMFADHYESNGWMVGKTKMRDWKAAVRTWERNDNQKRGNSNGRPDTRHWRDKLGDPDPDIGQF